MSTTPYTKLLPAALGDIEEAIARLDTRSHDAPARMELSRSPEPAVGWVAQLIADPLRRTLTGTGRTPPEAICVLAEATYGIDYRKVGQ